MNFSPQKILNVVHFLVFTQKLIKNVIFINTKNTCVGFFICMSSIVCKFSMHLNYLF